MHYLLNLFHFTGSNIFMYSRILFNFTCTIYSFANHYNWVYSAITAVSIGSKTLTRIEKVSREDRIFRGIGFAVTPEL